MRSWNASCAALAIIVSYATCCQAQTGGNVTVQLPTFEYFGVSTTVVVPDRGSMYLGGVNRSSLGSSQFGPGLGNRAIGRASSAGGLSISATIIDHDEIDRALLAEAARRRGDRFDIRGRPVAEAPRIDPRVVGQRGALARDGRNPLAPRRFRQLSGSSSTAEAQRAETYLQRGRRAEDGGQPHLAKVFYQRVVKHGDAAEKRLAEDRLAFIAANIKSSARLRER